jgi:hypothetical protein
MQMFEKNYFSIPHCTLNRWFHEYFYPESEKRYYNQVIELNNFLSNVCIFRVNLYGFQSPEAFNRYYFIILRGLRFRHRRFFGPVSDVGHVPPVKPYLCKR